MGGGYGMGALEVLELALLDLGQRRVAGGGKAETAAETDAAAAAVGAVGWFSFGDVGEGIHILEVGFGLNWG